MNKASNDVQHTTAQYELEREHWTGHLQELVDSEANVLAATMSTIDGFEIASASLTLKHLAHGSKLAAVTSSLQALGTAVAHELELSPFESVTIEAQRGRMLVVDIRLGPRTFILAVVAAKPSLLAQTLIATRHCALQIAATMAALHAGGDPPPVRSAV